MCLCTTELFCPLNDNYTSYVHWQDLFPVQEVLRSYAAQMVGRWSEWVLSKDTGVHVIHFVDPTIRPDLLPMRTLSLLQLLEGFATVTYIDVVLGHWLKGLMLLFFLVFLVGRSHNIVYKMQNNND